MAVDKYDDSVRIKDVNYEVYLEEKGSYNKDNNYAGTSITDVNGEAYVQYGKYVTSNPNGSETRTIRIIETNLSDRYRPIRYYILVNVTFDANGIIESVSVPGGYHSNRGVWVSDTRFVSVTHSRHTVSVTIKHYPYLFMNVKAEDMYTQDELVGKYKISTSYGPGYSYIDTSKLFMQEKIEQIKKNVYETEGRDATLEDVISALKNDVSIDRVKVAEDGLTITVTVDRTIYTVDAMLEVTKAHTPGNYSGTSGLTNIDYMGYGSGEILVQTYETTDDGQWTSIGIGPAEKSTSRTFYIYEEAAPSSPMQYQQYRPRYLSWEYSKIVASITVNYNEKGRVDSYTIDEKSNNNIEQFIDIEIVNGLDLNITIKYAPTTTMEVTTIDSVSKAPLSNVRVSPYLNSDYATKQSYEYRTIGYYTTDTNGQTNYTYWGANLDDGQNEYHIDTSLMGYLGYFASGVVKIHVAYDEYGRISAADVLTKDQNGVPNAEIVSFADNKLKINILYNRKFNITIEKQDEYDSNTKLTTQFNVKSNKDDDVTMKSDSLTTLGMIRPGEKVKYTLSELVVPQGYIPLENLDFYITYNMDGTIKDITSNSQLFEVISIRNQVDSVRATTVEDLKIAIKNEPRFTIKLNVMDRYYNEKKLSGVAFTITSDKGDTSVGNPVTNDAGSLTAYVGKTFRNETVTYTIKQDSTPNGYYEVLKDIVVSVEFNDYGKIKNYYIVNGDSRIVIDPSKYQNERYIEIDDLLNTPKDIMVGIKNYDEITNEAISGVTYKITAEEVSTGTKINEKEFITNADGTVIDSINEFKETPNKKRIINYTISQITIPDSYRKIQDVVVQMVFNEDGSIAYGNTLSNPSGVIVKPSSYGKLQYLNGESVHLLLEIPNDNKYDLIIKNEDKNYQGLGIAGTIYDISINGENLEATTGSDGIASILNRADVGEITIRIAEKEPGIGYQKDENNDTIIKLQKGEKVYSLDLISNSNPNVNVVVSDVYGTVTVTFKNETRSSITLIKDNREVRYELTAKEKLSDGTFVNEQIIGSDLTEPIAKDTLYYELGVTPQNKTIVYTFKELNAPVGYYKTGDIEVTVEYDMYGDIISIEDNSDRVDAIEEVEGSHDIIVIISEYKEPSSGSGSGGGTGGPGGTGVPWGPGGPSEEKYKFSTLTIVKDDKDVKYEVSVKEIDEHGNISSAKVIGNELTSNDIKEQLYYELGSLKPNTQLIIEIKELSIPDNYVSNGIIEVTATVDENGYIKQIVDNCNNAEAKLAPVDSNHIIVVLGKEYGSLTLLKDNADVKYQTNAYDKNSDGTYTNEQVLGKEEANEDSKRVLYYSFRTQKVNKTEMYKFIQISVPTDYVSKGSLQAESEYDSNGSIVDLNSNNSYLIVEESPLGSLDIVANILTDPEKKAWEDMRNGYTVKIASQEVNTNLRINDTTFDIDIIKDEGTINEEHFKKVEGVKTANLSKKGYIVDKGIIQIDELKKDGEISIHIDETEPAEGNKFGNQITSGVVTVNVSYHNNSMEPSIDLISTGTIPANNVTIDSVNKIIFVTIYNEPEALMKINNVIVSRDSEGNLIEEPLYDSKFVITSQIQTKTLITNTDLNVTTAKTDEEGNTQAKVGDPYPGKTVLYTIHQNEIEGYNTINDIVVLIEYDTKGLIKYFEVLSNPDDAEVLGEIGTRVIKVKVKNEVKSNKYGYKIVIEKHHIDDGYYEELIPGAKFKIEVEQEYGEYYTTWEAITNEEGIITSGLFDGYGYITIRLTELEAPEGFKHYTSPIEIRVQRDKETGKLRPISLDDNYDLAEDNSIIYIKPQNEPKDELYTIIANKADKKTGILITESQAEFEVKMYEQENIGTDDEPVIEEVETYLGTFQTNNKGKAKVENQLKPEKAGIYKYVFTETKAPDGYVELEEPVVLQVEFIEDEKGQIRMGDAQILSGDASIRSKKDDLLNITINNLNEKDVNKYTLDITKVDAQTNEAIKDMAIFKVWLPDEQNTAVYTETMTNEYGDGKLDYCYIEQDKDYEVRLTRMEIPTEEAIIKYVFREIKAPEGYTEVEEDLVLNIEFKKDEDTGKIYIANATSSNEDYLRINTPTPCLAETPISIDILNNSKSSKKYTVHYEANDNGEGTIVPNDQTKDKGIDLVLDTMVPQRDGYTFKGWAVIPTDTNVQFKPGDTYAIDQDITLYAIWDEKLFLESENYIISDETNYTSDENGSKYVDGDSYVFGIKPAIGAKKNKPENEGTTVNTFIDNINTNADTIKVLDLDGNELPKTELIGTGMKLVLIKGQQKIELSLVVLGDVNGNGVLDGSDKTNASNYINLDDVSRFDTIEKKLALDVNLDGKIKPSDLTILRKALSEDDNTVMGKN